MFGTEKVICPKNSEGWLVGFGTALVWIDPNYFGSLCSNPNKIQTNDMVGGVMYFCPLFSFTAGFPVEGCWF